MTTGPTQRPVRQRLAEIMEPYQPGPLATRLSLWVDLFILACILASCALVPLELCYPRHGALFWKLEVFFVAVFVIEYLLRWCAAENRLLYPLGLFAIIDLVAILPTLLMMSQSLLMLRLLRGVRLARLLRLLRLLRIVRFGFLIYRGLVELRIWLSAINHQYHVRELGRLFAWALVAWIVGANVVHFTETALVGDQGPFASYWKSYWHILIVLVSGIEDKEPLSLLGRVEVTVLMVVGICVVGMLTGEIVSILVKKVQRAGKLAIKPPRGAFERHIVILGRNSHLDNIIRQITAALGHHSFILVVCPDAEEIRVTDPAVYRRVFALSGDPVEAHVLEQADVARALRVVVLSSEDEDEPRTQRDNRALMATMGVLCQGSSQGAPGFERIPVVTELSAEESLTYAAPLDGVDLLIGRHYGERLIGQAVLQPGVTEIYERLLTFTEDTNEFYPVPVPVKLVGKTFAEAQLLFLDRPQEPVTLVGLDRSPPGAPFSRFWLNPTAELGDEDLVLRQDDRLIVLAYELPGYAFTEEERWSGKILSRR